MDVTRACGERKVMLEGVETGYEDKYDFPYREEWPRLGYVLASVPRTGSTYVSHLLWQSGCLGAPLEYLNFLPGSPYAFAHGSPEKQRELWRSLLHRRTSPNGVFGVKCFSAQFRELQQQNPQLLMDVIANLLPQGAKLIRLKRRDRVAHAISYARAALSGVWHKVQENGDAPAVAYSDEAVDHARRLLDHQDADWDMLFREQGVQQLTLWYEDVLEAPEETVRSVANFLAIQLDAAAAVAVPPIKRQSQEDPALWAERYGKRINPA
jgi:trehalose 2-sulfotransferase